MQARRRIRATVTAMTERELDRFFSGLADAVIAAAAEREPELRAVPSGRLWNQARQAHDRKEITLSEWAQLLNALFDQQSDILEGIIEQAYIQVLAGSWPIFNAELAENIQFNVNDPLVVEILGQAGENIQGIVDTTLDALRPALQDLYEEGADIETIASRVRDLVEETYSGRSRAIARTETGNAANLATSGRYRAANVRHVRVFDNGFKNSHPFCKRVDGKTVTLEWAERNPLQHPNCVRAFGAVFNYEGDVFTEEEPWN